MNSKLPIIREDREFPLKDLKLDSRNARLHSLRNVEAIMSSLKSVGQHRPFVVQDKTDIICIGNGMFDAMQRLKWETGWVVWVEDNDSVFLERSIADNQSGVLAYWDSEQLAVNLGELKELNVDLVGLGFDSEELEGFSQLDEDLDKEPKLMPFKDKFVIKFEFEDKSEYQRILSLVLSPQFNWEKSSPNTKLLIIAIDEFCDNH